MFNKISKSFYFYGKLLTPIILLTVLVTNYNIQESASNFKKITNFENGIQTCFMRVNQSFTAKLLNDSSSNYLSSNFQSLTEECFAEAVVNLEDSFKSNFLKASKVLNTLASNVHWFHEDILAPENLKKVDKNLKENEYRDVGSRFEKIEQTKDEILDLCEKFKSSVELSLKKQKNIFIFSTIFLLIFILIEMLLFFRNRIINKKLEKEAKLELNYNTNQFSTKSVEIITDALIANNLNNCSLLFANYKPLENLDSKLKAVSKLDIEKLITPVSNVKPNTTVNAITTNEIIEKVWENDNLAIDLDNKIEVQTIKQVDNLMNVNLEKICSDYLDTNVDKFFSKGILVNIDIPKNFLIKGHLEGMEVAIFHLMNFAVGVSNDPKIEKSVRLVAKKIGDLSIFDFYFKGKGFTDGLTVEEILESSNLDLKIAISIFLETTAKLQFENTINQIGEVEGGHLKILFKSGVNESRLVDLKIGNKKELKEILEKSM